MPLIEAGPLAGFYAPEYESNSIVNLLSSIIHGRGGASPHTPISALPVERVHAAKQVVYLVVDGLGCEQVEEYLATHPDSPFLSKHYHTMTTVFPATTAAAITSFSTGATPLEHGIFGWFMHFPDLGAVSTVLLGVTRTGTPLVELHEDLGAALQLPSYMNSVQGRKECLSYGGIAQSRYSKASGNWSNRVDYQTLSALEKKVRAFVDDDTPGLAYVYWPEYDTLCHAHGTTHPKTVKHLERIDVTLAELESYFSQRDVLLIVSADHGLIDVPKSRWTNLIEVPGFYDMLATLPYGDSRQVQCKVRPNRLTAFDELVADRFGDSVVSCEGAWLIDQGVYGSGTPHPQLHARMGDRVLIARDDYAFAMPTPKESYGPMVGYHSGMSKREMLVPVYLS